MDLISKRDENWKSQYTIVIKYFEALTSSPIE